MSLRRIAALIALAAAFLLWYAGKNQFSGSFLAPLIFMVAPIVGLFALAVLIFNLQVFGSRFEDSGFGVLSERQGSAFGALALVFLGAALVFIGARGLYQGRIPALGSGPDLIYAKAPIAYVLTFAAWFTGGVAVGGLAWLVWRRRAKRSARGEA